MGRVLRAHGIQGELIVRRFGESEAFLTPGTELRMGEGENAFERRVIAARPHGREWRVGFEGVSDRDGAEALQGLHLSVNREALPDLPEGSFYRFQLVGLSVRTAEGKQLGRIEEILETGAHDVCVVRGAGLKDEILIPAVDALVHVDLEAGEMVVRAIPGLIPGEDGEEGESR
ncbi:MAG TPA: ribosome maturation factor RimM [Candidatus Eisenbacteria bacterium]|nr:ribosome maturation factor RimM [Candidatus Eisenbacteria bacterium]